MARIPLGNFGNMIAEPQRRARVIPEAFDHGAGAMQKLGETGMKLAADALETQRKTEEKVQLLTAHAGIQTGVEDLHDQTVRGIADGSIAKDKAESVFTEGITKLVGEKAQTLPPELRKVIEADSLGIAGRYANKVRDAVVLRNQQETRVALNNFLTVAQRSALMDRDKALNQSMAAIESMAPGAGLNPVEAQEMQKKAREGIAYTLATRMVSDAGRSIESVDTALKALDAPEYADLDAKRREALHSSLVNTRTRLETRALHEADRRKADAAKAVQEFASQITTTNKARPEDYVAWADRVKGTEEEARFNELLVMEREVQKVLALPPEQQDKFLSDARAAQRMNGASEQQVKLLTTLDRAVSENRKTMVEQPLKYLAERTGQAFQPLTPALLQQGGEAVQKEFQNRFAALNGLRQTTGGRTDLKLFTQDEADQIGKALREAAPAAQGMMLGLLKHAAGDPAAYSDTVRQLAKDDSVLAFAGVAHARGLRNTQGLAISDLLLEGRAVLRDSTFKMPADKTGDTSLVQAFNAAIGNAIEPGAAAREDTFQAAKAIYAKIAKDSGINDGILNAGMFGKAVQLATGGVVEHAGYKTIPPYGMDADVFNDKALAAKRGAAIAHGYPADSFVALQVRPIAPNRYELLNGQRRQLGKDGRPVFLTID